MNIVKTIKKIRRIEPLESNYNTKYRKINKKVKLSVYNEFFKKKFYVHINKLKTKNYLLHKVIFK